MRSPAPLLLAALLILGAPARAADGEGARDASSGVEPGRSEAVRAPGGRTAPEAAAGRPAEAVRLRALKIQIEREQRAVHAVEAARSTLVENLRALDQALAGAEEARLAAERETRTAQRALSGTEAGIARLEEERAQLEAQLAERLRALYKFGRVGYVRILFSSKDYQDFARRSRFLGVVVASDADLVDEFRSRISALRVERGRLDAARRDLGQREQAATARGGEAKARQAEKFALLSRLEQEKDAREEALRDLERSAGALQGVFFRLREVEPAPGPPTGLEASAPSRETSVGFSVLKGRLPLPAEGRIIKTFGLRTDPELGTRIRSNGITVRASYGAPIRAVAGGRVLYAGWFRGYGRILIVDHGEGYYTLVAHASELVPQVGDTVSAGDEIARVGDSGSLEGPIVYFEIRKEGKPLDPKEWIRS